MQRHISYIMFRACEPDLWGLTNFRIFDFVLLVIYF